MTVNIIGSIADQSLRELDLLSDQVFSNLLNVAPSNYLPEAIFRDFFLPRLLGIVKDESGWARDWIAIAGSPMAEVGIKGSNGEHLFNVPPFFNTGGIIDPTGKGSIHDIFYRSEQYKLNSPLMAVNFLNQELGKKLVEYESGANNQYLDRWAEIAKRYGLYPEVTEVAPKEVEEDLFDFG